MPIIRNIAPTRGKTMKRLTAILLTAACATPLGLLPATAQAQSITAPASNVVLSIGRGELVSVPGRMADIFVANEAVADVQVKSERQLYIFGKSGGVTTVYASNAAGDVIWSANVRVGSNIDSIDQMLALAMPEAKVSVATMGTNTVLLTGTVAAPEDAAEAERLVSAFVGEEANVISRLKMATPLQVNLRVRFAEVNRNFARAIGTNLLTVDQTSGFKFGVTTGRGAIPTFTPGSPGGLGVGVTGGPGGSSIVTQGTGTTLGAFGKFLGLDIGAALDLAENSGLVTTLSQPNLTALSGETADFLAGGEYPYQAAAGLGATSVVFKPYGISLAYSPTVLANGRISLRLRSEVSELDFSSGLNIPGLTTRRAETTIEVGSGQSFMIAGLLSNRAQNSIQKAPGLGDVPILGNLFRSTNYRRGETELVIVVTPYLVNPVNDSDIKLPTDGFRSPNEAQRLLGFYDSDGTSATDAYRPSAAQGEAPPPAVSTVDPAALPTGPVQAAADDQPTRPRRGEKPAAPGFSLN